VSCAKTAEPVELPFGFSIQVGQMKKELDGSSDSRWEEAIIGEKGAVGCKV